MAYEKQTSIPVAEGETVVKLTDTGDLVAVQCPMSRDELTNRVIFMPAARWVDDHGATKADTAGRNVATVKTLSMSADDVTRVGRDATIRECLLLMLGEPLTPDPTTPDVTIIPWSADIVSQCSIRNAISAARVTAPAAADVL